MDLDYSQDLGARLLASITIQFPQRFGHFLVHFLPVSSVFSNHYRRSFLNIVLL